MKKRTKKKVNPIVFKIVIAVLVLVITILSFMFYFKVKELNAARAEDRNALQSQITSMQRNGYVAAADLKMGTLLTEDLLLYRTDIPSDLDQGMFITVDDLGKTLITDVSTGMPIFKTNISESAATEFTERECNFIYLNANMKSEDYADVRIMFPNGEDYIIAAKKCLKNVNVFYNSCYLWLTEAENDLLSAAIVDANINGAKIYVNKYVSPAIQKASIVTYNPNEDVINAMHLNPNIVGESEVVLSDVARRDTEKRLQEFRELYPEYVIDDQLVDDISRQDFVSGSIGDTGSGDSAATGGSSNIDITQPLPDSGGNASIDSGAEGTVDDSNAEEVDLVE